jgi:hypothetical protein
MLHNIGSTISTNNVGSQPSGTSFTNQFSPSAAGRFGGNRAAEAGGPGGGGLCGTRLRQEWRAEPGRTFAGCSDHPAGTDAAECIDTDGNGCRGVDGGGGDSHAARPAAKIGARAAGQHPPRHSWCAVDGGALCGPEWGGEQLAVRLNEQGFNETKSSIASKLSRETLTAAFFVATLKVLDKKNIELDSLE